MLYTEEPIKVFIDTETRSMHSLKDVSAYKYLEDAAALLVSYQIGMWGEPKLWKCLESPTIPSDLEEALNGDSIIYAHNAAFDRLVLRELLNINIPVERWRCTSTYALILTLPAKLDVLESILFGKVFKHASGAELIVKFCLPDKKSGKFTEPEDAPDDFKLFCDYALQDVSSLVEVYKALTRDHGDEYFDKFLDGYVLDQKINDRGIRIDLDFSRKVKGLLDGAATGLVSTFEHFINSVEMSDEDRASIGRLNRPSQHAKFKKWLSIVTGKPVDNTQASTIQELYEYYSSHEKSNPDLVGALEMSLALSKSASTSKYAKFLRESCKDSRIRGCYIYCGASRTRRWSVKTVQMQNLPNPKGVSYEDIVKFIDDTKLGVNDTDSRSIYRKASACVRSAIIPSEGRKLFVSDLANIEGRINAFISNQDWKLDNFREYDKGVGEDPYISTAKIILGKSAEEVTKDERTAFGKVPELALGYGGGAGALQKSGLSYGVRYTDFEDIIRANIDKAYFKKAEYGWDTYGSLAGIDYDEWVLLEAVKLSWRARNVGIVDLWRSIQSCVSESVIRPGAWIEVNNYLAVSYTQPNLFVRLPSSRKLIYTNFKISRDGDMSFESYDRLKRRYVLTNLTGGKIVENICQSLASECLMEGMLNIEKEFDIVMHTHDEVIAEGDPNQSIERFSKLLATPPSWCLDIPLKAEGVILDRYRKI